MVVLRRCKLFIVVTIVFVSFLINSVGVVRVDIRKSNNIIYEET